MDNIILTKMTCYVNSKFNTFESAFVADKLEAIAQDNPGFACIPHYFNVAPHPIFGGAGRARVADVLVELRPLDKPATSAAYNAIITDCKKYKVGLTNWFNLPASIRACSVLTHGNLYHVYKLRDAAPEHIGSVVPKKPLVDASKPDNRIDRSGKSDASASLKFLIDIFGEYNIDFSNIKKPQGKPEDIRCIYDEVIFRGRHIIVIKSAVVADSNK